MALSRLAREFAAEINFHDWSDAPYRIDRAGHKRELDSPRKRTNDVLSKEQADAVRMNVMWVAAQVLGHADPKFDAYEFAGACGVNTRNSRGGKDGTIAAGLRFYDGRYDKPGTFEPDEPGEPNAD